MKMQHIRYAAKNRTHNGQDRMNAKGIPGRKLFILFSLLLSRRVKFKYGRLNATRKEKFRTIAAATFLNNKNAFNRNNS